MEMKGNLDSRFPKIPFNGKTNNTVHGNLYQHDVYTCPLHIIPHKVRFFNVRNLHGKHWAIGRKRIFGSKLIQWNWMVKWQYIQILTIKSNDGYSCKVVIKWVCVHVSVIIGLSGIGGNTGNKMKN